jgi:hypothetical protein
LTFASVNVEKSGSQTEADLFWAIYAHPRLQPKSPNKYWANPSMNLLISP